MAKGNSKSLQELIESGTFEEVHEKLFHLGADVIRHISHQIFPTFLQKFKQYEQREKFISTLLNKIEIFEKDEKSNVTDFTPLKALCLSTKGKDTLENKRTHETKDLKFQRHENTLKLMEAASKLYQNLLENEGPGETRNNYLTIEQQIQKLISEMITNYEDLEEGIKLAELSSQHRKSNFCTNHPNTLQMLLLLAKLGTKSTVLETQIKCLNDAELAYNTICKSAITSKSAEQISSLLGYMSALYSIFGDKLKAKELTYEASSILQKLRLSSLAEANSSNKTIEVLDERTLILKKGLTNLVTLKIKSLIQDKILTPIQAEAAKAKWHEEWGFSRITTEYGVAGYVEESYLKRILSTNFNEANHKIALSLCFEAINIGIMTSLDKNPLTAAIFCAKFPALVKEILSNHPEYFVDGHILQTSLLNASQYFKGLLGNDNVVVNSSYNKLFEAAITPFITERIKCTVLLPLKNLATGDSWSSWHTSEVKRYLSEEFLLQGYTLSASALGNNLSLIPDIINIVRILAFEALAQAITDKGLTNFIPIEIFIKTYPDLNLRIIEDHKEYLTNKFILKLCENGKVQHLKKVAPDEIDLSCSVIQLPVETPLLGENPSGDNLSIDGKHEDVS